MPRRSPKSINNIDQCMKNTENNDAKIKRIKDLIQIERGPPQNNESSPGVMNNLRKKARDIIKNPASKLGFGVGSNKKRIEYNEANFSSIINTNTKPNIENRRNTIRKKWKQQATRERANRARMLARLRVTGRADQIRELLHAPPRGRALHQTSSDRNPMFRHKRQSKSNNTKNNPFANFKGGKTRKRRKKKN